MRSFKLVLVTMGAVLALLVGSCGPSDPDTFTQTCQRADECNRLQGTSVNDCVETFQTEVRDLTPSEQADFETFLQDCLELRDCSNFAFCLGI